MSNIKMRVRSLEQKDAGNQMSDAVGERRQCAKITALLKGLRALESGQTPPKRDESLWDDETDAEKEENERSRVRIAAALGRAIKD